MVDAILQTLRWVVFHFNGWWEQIVDIKLSGVDSDVSRMTFSQKKNKQSLPQKTSIRIQNKENRRKLKEWYLELWIQALRISMPKYHLKWLLLVAILNDISALRFWVSLNDSFHQPWHYALWSDICKTSLISFDIRPLKSSLTVVPK